MQIFAARFRFLQLNADFCSYVQIFAVMCRLLQSFLVKTLLSSRMDCKIFLIEICLNVAIILDVIDIASKSLRSEFSNVISKEISEILQVSALKTVSSNLGKNAIVTILKCMVCSKKYKFKIFLDQLEKSDDIKVEVFTNKTKCDHPDVQTTRPLKGLERIKTANELKLKSTKSYADEKLLEIDLELLKNTGNTQSLKSTEVFRKIRSEEKAKHDLNSNDLHDIYLKATSEENMKDLFIQKVTMFPFSVEVSFKKNLV